MSTDSGEEIFNIGARLKEERQKHGYSQETLGTRIGATGRTVKKYEANETSIRAVELLQLSEIGFDVFYIITGERLPGGVAQDRATYSVAADIGKFISDLMLSDADADLLRQMAVRLSK